MVKGYCAITADILHHGHVKFLKACKGLCDWLVVGVMTDKSVRKYKYKQPIMPFEERFEIVQSIKYADEVVAQNNFEFTSDFLNKINPDVVFDSTQHNRIVPNKIKKILIKYDETISSTKIKERVIASSRKRKTMLL